MASAAAASSATSGGRGITTTTTSPISSVSSPFLVGRHHHHRLWPQEQQLQQQQQHIFMKKKKKKKRKSNNNNTSKWTFVVAASASSMVEVWAGWIANGGNVIQHHLHDLVLAVGVGLPCTVMPCGDIIYRSTLPRPTGLSLTAPGLALALAALSYLWATPGVAPGFWDMFVLAFLERVFRPSYRKDDFVLGKKLGEGAFGVVYMASLSKTNKDSTIKKGALLVVKKATEYGAVEIWMNERVRRACSASCADFVYGFLESPSKGKGDEYWLIWDFEGEQTLSDLMTSKEFPYNVETMILGEAQIFPKGLDRENKIIQTIMRQLLFALDGLHSIGIVHRDIKPQNVIFSEGARTFKIIDLGAAADLRVGINYIPKEFLLDPRISR